MQVDKQVFLQKAKQEARNQTELSNADHSFYLSIPTNKLTSSHTHSTLPAAKAAQPPQDVYSPRPTGSIHPARSRALVYPFPFLCLTYLTISSYWILFPITIVMVLTGVLRHYATIMLASTPKPSTLPALREQRSLLRGINLRNNHAQLSPTSFQSRRAYLTDAYKEGAFLKDPANRGKGAANPMSDPAAMEGMMGAMKGNMMMMIPQSVIMGWINAFFAGFVICMAFLLSLSFVCIG